MKWDGASWNELGAGSNTLDTSLNVWAICTDKSGNLYAAAGKIDTGRDFNVYKWDGTSWSQLGTGSNALHANGYIMTLATDSHGNVYAAGEFTQSGYIYVARWDGTQWSLLGAGDNPLSTAHTGGSIRALYVDAADNIYTGGGFSNADRRSYVTKWDGASWTEIGSGGSSLVEYGPAWIDAITTDKAGNIYASGYGIVQQPFKYCVKKWDGTNWHELGRGGASINSDNWVRAICTDTSGNLYAGSYHRTENSGYSQVVKFDTHTITGGVANRERINAWPNPANDELYLEVNTYGEYYYIYNIQGILMQVMQNDKAGASTNQMYLNTLPRGTYILKTERLEPFVFIKN